MTELEDQVPMGLANPVVFQPTFRKMNKQRFPHVLSKLNVSEKMEKKDDFSYSFLNFALFQFSGVRGDLSSSSHSLFSIFLQKEKTKEKALFVLVTSKPGWGMACEIATAPARHGTTIILVPRHGTARYGKIF